MSSPVEVVGGLVGSSLQDMDASDGVRRLLRISPSVVLVLGAPKGGLVVECWVVFEVLPY